MDTPIILKVFEDSLHLTQGLDWSRDSHEQPHRGSQSPSQSMKKVSLGVDPFSGYWPDIFPPALTSLPKDDGMKRSVLFIRWNSFAHRQLSSSAYQSTPLNKTLQDRLPSRETWARAWRWFLWVPAVIFVNDHVVSLSPVNGISMRPTVTQCPSEY